MPPDVGVVAGAGVVDVASLDVAPADAQPMAATVVAMANSRFAELPISVVLMVRFSQLRSCKPLHAPRGPNERRMRPAQRSDAAGRPQVGQKFHPSSSSDPQAGQFIVVRF